MSIYSPFTDAKNDQVRSLSETALIREIRGWLGAACPEPPFGIGDDCAVCPITPDDGFHLITMDGVGWKHHFDENVAPASVGRKLLARNLSDIAAMGGVPRHGVIALWLSDTISLKWLKSFYEGLAELALAFDVKLVGGDVSSAPDGVFIADLCLHGSSRRPVLRKQVNAGDQVWVTGRLGGSLSEKHWSFQPRLKEGRWLGAHRQVKAMIDVSDGIGKDLPGLVGSYAIHLQDLPLSAAAEEASRRSGKTAVWHAMNDGEDYELLFAVKADTDKKKFRAEWEQRFDTELTCLGELVDSPNPGHFVWLDDGGEATEPGRGYEHF